MISMNQSNYVTASQNYAKNAQDAYEQSLSYLLNGLDEAKIADQKAANIRYENLITKIRQQLPGIQQQFEKNAKAAYINKQQIVNVLGEEFTIKIINTKNSEIIAELNKEIRNRRKWKYSNIIS